MDLFTKAEKIMLGRLSAYSRSSITALASLAGCSRITAVKNLHRLEKKLDMRYTLEVDEGKLGVPERHIVVVRFLKRPTAEFLREFFKDDNTAHIVYTLRGDYDLFIYARSADPVSYIKWETNLASELSEYRPLLKPSEFVVSQFGFWPLGSSFVNEINESVKADSKDRQILTLLNQNSRMSIQEIAKRTGMKRGRVRYRLLGLKKRGMVKRFTIAVQNPPQKFRLMHFINYRFNRNINERMLEIRRRYMDMDGEHPLLNTMQVIAPMSGSFRSFGFSIFPNEEDGMERVVEANERTFRKDDADVSHAVVDKVIKGLLPFRNLDIRANYLPIQWEKAAK